jgi:hypothetical protein
LDDFITEDNILDEVLDQTMGFLKTSLEALQKEADDHRLHPRKYIKRPREEFGQRLFDDYFSEDPVYPSNIFRRRFRMSRPLFLCIVNALGQWSDYFTQRVDATNRQGLTPLQKCTVVIRQIGKDFTRGESESADDNS